MADVSFALFTCLPNEVKQIIFDLSDGPTRTSLAVASPDWRTFVTSINWRDLRITRPSILLIVLQSLQKRSELAKLVRGIHIGPDEPLPKTWSPLVIHSSDWVQLGGGFAALPFNAQLRSHTPSMRSSIEEESSRLWPLVSSSRDVTSSSSTSQQSCLDQAVFRALAAAQRFVNVDLQHDEIHYLDKDCNTISPALYLLRCFKVQAVLDLFLLWVEEKGKLPQHPDGECGGFNKTCPSYPSVVFSTEEEEHPLSKIMLTDDDLEHHLANCPGVDKFNHPLAFARAGLPTSLLGSGKVDIDTMEPAYIAELRQRTLVATVGELEGALKTIESWIDATRLLLSLIPLARVELTGILDKVINAQSQGQQHEEGAE